MARRNSRFVNQKIIIGNKSIQAGDLTDSAKDELGADSAFVKTVDGLDGSKISANTIDSSGIGTGAITNTKYGGGLSVDANNNLAISGHAKTNLVELDDSAVVTYDLSQGNIARWNRDSSIVDATNTLTITGTSGGTLDGMGFMVMAYNGDANSDRSITFAGGSGITIFYGDSSTITWSGPTQHTVISGLVFDSATVIVNTAAMTGSI